MACLIEENKENWEEPSVVQKQRFSVQVEQQQPPLANFHQAPHLDPLIVVFYKDDATIKSVCLIFVSKLVQAVSFVEKRRV